MNYRTFALQSQAVKRNEIADEKWEKIRRRDAVEKCHNPVDE
jgi:hypothetical protein